LDQFTNWPRDTAFTFEAMGPENSEYSSSSSWYGGQGQQSPVLCRIFNFEATGNRTDKEKRSFEDGNLNHGWDRFISAEQFIRRVSLPSQCGRTLGLTVRSTLGELAAGGVTVIATLEVCCAIPAGRCRRFAA